MNLVPLALALAAALPSEGPFLDLDYPAARALAVERGKLLLVDFTATWCPPCKRMDAETWVDPVVRAWLEQNALAIQVDVDEEPELAAELGIEALPTVVALRAGEVFGRVVGFQDPGKLLTWGYAVLRGERRVERLAERARELTDSDDADARWELAKELARTGRHDEALEHFLWLWGATREIPKWGGVRLSFLLAEYARLAAAYPPAREAFLGLLDDVQERVDREGVPQFIDWQEWTSLAQHLGEAERVLAWYEARRDDAGRLFAGEPASFRRDLVGDTILDLLLERERYEEAVALVREPLEKARKAVERFEDSRSIESGSADFQEEIEAFHRSTLIDELAVLHGLCLRAGRDAEAGEIGGMLLGAVDTPEARTALVEKGLTIGGRRHVLHASWLEEAALAGSSVSSLRRKLEALGD